MVKGSRSFSNAEAGFEELGVWIEKRTREVSTLLFVMEATGVYYENLAYWLEEHGVNVSVEPANKVKHYARSLSVKTQKDKVDASVSASMGLERELGLRHPMSVVYRELRDVSCLKLAYKRNLNALSPTFHASGRTYCRTAG